MATPRIRYSPPFTRYVVEQRIFDDHPFSLVDVGASGGIEQHWRVFGEALRAWGFDPLVAEIGRLNSTKPSMNVSYHALRVAGPPQARKEPLADRPAVKNNQPFTRTSAAEAISILNMNYVQKFCDPAGSGATTDEETSVDEFFAVTAHSGIDFIKIDTDGADFDVLLGAERVMAEAPCLGIFIEVQFHGFVSADANLFCNIDSLLRARGLSLFDVEVYRYSRSALPKVFALDIPAQTQEGQVLFGDALYLRDVGDPNFERMWGISLTGPQILKLAALNEIYGLEDCAAEILCKYREELGELVDVSHCLNLLTPDWRGVKLTFEKYRSAFRSDPRQWLPGAETQGLPPQSGLDAVASGSAGSLNDQQLRIACLEAQVAKWQTFWQTVEHSSGWRFLSAWRRVRDRLAPSLTRRRRLYDSMIRNLRHRV